MQQGSKQGVFVKSLENSRHVPDLFRHAIYSDNKRIYMLMGFVPGGELFSHLQKAPGRCFTTAAAQFYTASVLLALEYLHEQHIVYRWVKGLVLRV